MRFSRQEYWSGLPCPPPGDLPDPGMDPTPLMPAMLAGGFFTSWATWEVHKKVVNFVECFFCIYGYNHLISFSVFWHDKLHYLKMLNQPCRPGINATQLWCIILLFIVGSDLLIFCWEFYIYVYERLMYSFIFFWCIFLVLLLGKCWSYRMS